MKMIFVLAIVAIVLISGCASGVKTSPKPSLSSSVSSPTASPIQTTTAISEPFQSPMQIFEPTEFDNSPLISSSSLNPSNPSALDPFTLEVTAQDDKGIRQFSWESSKALSQGQSGSFDCNLQKTCSAKWQFAAKEEGVQKITVYAIDSSGQQTKADFALNIGPARPVKSAAPATSPSPTPSTTPSPSVSVAGSCSSDSGCGYKQVCSAGKCVDVQCTTDSQCTGCKRCSSNSCVSCGYGPYGCYC